MCRKASCSHEGRSLNRQIDIPGTAELVRLGPAVDKVRAVMRALERVEKPYAEATKAAYETARERYAVWCDDFKVEPFPLTPLQLIGHLEWLSTLTTRTGQPTAPSTVRQTMAALCSMDRWQRTTPEDPNPRSIAEGPIVQRWLTHWGKSHPIAPRKQAPIVGRGQLLRIIDTLQKPTPGAAAKGFLVRASRDRAIWLVGIGGALRVGDLCSLAVTDVVEEERGLLITLRKRKADQLGRAQTVGIEHARTLELCPVRAWRAWVALRGTWSGPAFCGVLRSGNLSGEALYTRSLQRILKETAARAEVDVSGHSPRRTLATTALRNGRARHVIQRHGGWSRSDSMTSYFSIEDAWEDNVTRGLFDEREP